MFFGFERRDAGAANTVIASGAKQSIRNKARLDCFVASLPCTNASRLSLAMSRCYHGHLAEFNDARGNCPLRHGRA
jgi:hypothetical protein